MLINYIKRGDVTNKQEPPFITNHRTFDGDPLHVLITTSANPHGHDPQVTGETTSLST